MNNVATILSRNPRLGMARLILADGAHRPIGYRLFHCLSCCAATAVALQSDTPSRCPACRAQWVQWPPMTTYQGYATHHGEAFQWSVCPEMQYDAPFPPP